MNVITVGSRWTNKRETHFWTDTSFIGYTDVEGPVDFEVVSERTEGRKGPYYKIETTGCENKTTYFVEAELLEDPHIYEVVKFKRGDPVVYWPDPIPDPPPLYGYGTVLNMDAERAEVFYEESRLTDIVPVEQLFRDYRICTNCQHPAKYHVFGNCLFTSTRYRPGP